jgi:hypothetical protein
MKRVALGAIAVLLLVAGWRLMWRGNPPVIEWATKFHATHGSTDCGIVTNFDGDNGVLKGRESVKCALSAVEQGRPFFVIFSGHGVDERISHALVSDGRGSAIQLFYGTGMVDQHHISKNRCDVPLKLIVEEKSPYGFPRIHCSPWPPPQSRISADFLLW